MTGYYDEAKVIIIDILGKIHAVKRGAMDMESALEYIKQRNAVAKEFMKKALHAGEINPSQYEYAVGLLDSGQASFERGCACCRLGTVSKPPPRGEIVCPNCGKKIFMEELVSGKCPLCGRGLDESPASNKEIKEISDNRQAEKNIEDNRLVRLAKWFAERL